MSTKKTNEMPIDDAHAFRDTTGRKPLDALLRKHGWSIFRRVGKNEPIWKKGDVEAHEGAILASLPRKEVQQAITLDKYEESEG